LEFSDLTDFTPIPVSVAAKRMDEEYQRTISTLSSSAQLQEAGGGRCEKFARIFAWTSGKFWWKFEL